MKNSDNFLWPPSPPTEWWYHCGFMKGDDAEDYDYSIVIYKESPYNSQRLGLTPLYFKIFSKPIIRVYATLTLKQKQAFLYFEKISPFFNLESADATEGFAVRSDDGLYIEELNNTLTIKVQDSSFALDLKCDITPTMYHLVDHGNRNDQTMHKIADSCIFDKPNLFGTGKIRIYNNVINVSGKMWSERGRTSIIPGNFLAIYYDFFYVMLNDGSLVGFSKSHKSNWDLFQDWGGNYFDSKGNMLKFKLKDINIEEVGQWISPKTGVKYPSLWHYDNYSLDLHLNLLPVLQDQEIDCKHVLSWRFWHGSCEVEGTKGKEQIRGKGFVGSTREPNMLGRLLLRCGDLYFKK